MKKYLIVSASTVLIFLNGCTNKEYITQPMPILTYWHVNGLNDVNYTVIEEQE